LFDSCHNSKFLFAIRALYRFGYSAWSKTHYKLPPEFIGFHNDMKKQSLRSFSFQHLLTGLQAKLAFFFISMIHVRALNKGKIIAWVHFPTKLTCNKRASSVVAGKTA
jgi:hypothetical protein